MDDQACEQDFECHVDNGHGVKPAIGQRRHKATDGHAREGERGRQADARAQIGSLERDHKHARHGQSEATIDRADLVASGWCQFANAELAGYQQRVCQRPDAHQGKRQCCKQNGQVVQWHGTHGASIAVCGGSVFSVGCRLLMLATAPHFSKGPMTGDVTPLHPGTIAELRAGSGVIGLAGFPGGLGGGAAVADGARTEGPALEAIARWGASSVVTLIEADAPELSRAAGLAVGLGQLTIDWHHLPIDDMQVPDAAFERDWTYHGHVLRQRLQRGDRILLHCRAGLGRAGMIAARLLVELGTAPDDAIAAVRAVRPGAIETTAQAAHVQSCREVTVGPHADRVLGCLIGGAIGDAFGYPVEFLSLAQIRRAYGAAGIAAPDLDPDGRCVVSDDTQMTLFTVEGLVDGLVSGGDPVEHFRQAYLAWYGTQHSYQTVEAAADRVASYAELHVCRAPGKTCLSALENGGRGRIELPVNSSKGCGGVMRTAPIGLVRTLSPEQCLDLGARAAAITHGHPSGYWTGGAIAAMVRYLCEGVDTERAVRQTIGLLKGCAHSAETVKALEGALDPRVRTIGALGGGWVGEEALAMGVYAVLRGKQLKDVLMIAVNHDGDSDSTGSIAGQLWGARAGVADIPVGWVSVLDVRAPLNHVAGRLLAVV